MKKNIKFSVLIIALLMLCLCLTGCSELDTMREQQAFWTEKGSVDSITYNGIEYKRLPGYDPPAPTGYQFQPVFVTDPDVPVLLSNEFSTYMNLSDDGNFLTCYVSMTPEHDVITMYSTMYSALSNSYTSYEGGDATYCKADIYDEVVAKIEEGIEYTSYGYEYWVLDEETGVHDYKYYFLTDEQSDAINKVVEEVKPVPESEIPYKTLWIASLDKISEDKYFSKTSYEIYYDDYLEIYYVVYYSPSLGTHTHYEVPKKMNDIFDEISKQAVDSNTYYPEDTEI